MPALPCLDIDEADDILVEINAPCWMDDTTGEHRTVRVDSSGESYFITISES